MPPNRNHRERKSPRTKGWDYSQTATYFITICTYNRALFFGKICQQIMGLSQIGLVANWLWQQIPNQFPYVELDEFIVMPNHIHGILTIHDQRDYRNAINHAPMEDSIKQPGGATGWYNPMLSEGNLGKVIRWYKGRCTFEIRKRGHHHFQWQGRYWDDIIEDEHSLNRIRQYIHYNPLRWKSDRLYEKDCI